MSYTVTDAQRAVIVKALDSWMEDEAVTGISVDKITGRGKQRKQRSLGVFDRELLESLGSGDRVMDEALASYGALGGSLQVRCLYGDDRAGLRRAFNLVRTGSSSATGGSKGSDAAAEKMAGSMSGMLDSMARRFDSGESRTNDMFLLLLTQQKESADARAASEDILKTAMLETVRALEKTRGDVEIVRLESQIKHLEQENQGGLVASLVEFAVSPVGAPVVMELVGLVQDYRASLAALTARRERRAYPGRVRRPAPAPGPNGAGSAQPDVASPDPDGVESETMPPSV